MVLTAVKSLHMGPFLLLLLGVQMGQCLLRCHCLHPPHAVDEECRRNNNTCSSVRTTSCVLELELVFNGTHYTEEKTYDCQSSVGPSDIDFNCNITNEFVRQRCCRGSDFCNLDLEIERFLTPTTTLSPMATPVTSITSSNGPRNALYRRITIAVPVSAAFIITVSILALPTVLYLMRRRKKRIELLRMECQQQNGRESSPIYSPYSLDTLDLEGQTCTSGSGSGAPVLTQRTIACRIRVGEAIGSGRFGQVFLGDYLGDKVAVKKFSSYDEKSWFRESEVYRTVLLRHENILGFIGADLYSKDGVTELWLIMKFHPHGSLYDYLNRQTLSPKIMMRMAITICAGLTHLHTEVLGISAKPAIAHRDIKSKNILVKNSLECCIADFGLAVMEGPTSSVNFPTNPKQGTKRYMAPEILDETINMKKLEAFQKADIYSFGLVLWEVCKRCAHKNDSIGDYEPPFYSMVGHDPTFEEMKKVVVVDRQQPIIPSHWHSDELLHSMAEIMRECWYFNSNARNSALFYKSKLIELAMEDKIDYDTQE